MRQKGNQYAKRVKILKYVKSGAKWRFANIVEHNGKIIRDHVLIAGQDEHHREGTYYIEWYEIENHRHRQSVPDFADLLDAARRKAIEIEAMRAGVIRADTNPKTDDGSRIQIGAAIDSYLDWINHNRSHSTYRSYSNTLGNLLRKSCTKVYVRETERDDILKFMTDCYKAGLAARTVNDKVVVALQMFKHFGVTNLLRPRDWPKYVETIRPIYKAEEIRLMFQHAEEIEALFMKFLLCSGFRDQESQLPTRAARPCDCSQRAASEAPAFRVHLLPSRGPHASWPRKGNAGVQNSRRNLWSRAFS